MEKAISQILTALKGTISFKENDGYYICDMIDDENKIDDIYACQKRYSNKKRTKIHGSIKFNFFVRRQPRKCLEQQD